MHYLYILYSPTIDRFYIGETTNLHQRVIDHNNHKYQRGFTKAAKDWSIKLYKICESKQQAMFLEKFIKRMKSKKFILKVIENPSILDDIIDKNKK
ncbi:GIY-YIG nuclease family protein [Aquimarina litoralis]|uniref:GIY-YIG nuclease family protein n=1 Tax=Aquimarina litoralis TaxID=584605 RepID=UPI001C59FE8F|nr:GIY-YIG nuclease family protein [Aquimarina litoralis]MBW1295469.1 GIY-YIG nuclease family protein [Aquimarina litoralis]